MSADPSTMLSGVRLGEWLTRHWMRAGLVMAALLLAITPALARFLPWTLLLVYLQLPIYMLHQYEEHAQGAFQRYTTATLGQGRMLLSAGDILWINVGLVWALDVLWLLLAALVHPAWGLIAVAMPVVNGLLHLLDALRTRRYNPGLWTGLALFLPVGGVALVAIGQHLQVGGWTYELVLLAALLTHAPIALFVRRRLSVSAPR